MKVTKRDVINQCITLLLSYMVICGMSLNLLVSNEKKLSKIVSDTIVQNGIWIIAFMVLGYFALKPIVIKRKVTVQKFDVFLSMLVAFCILVGKSFVKYSNFYMFTANGIQVLKCLVALAAYTILITVMVSYIRFFINEKSFEVSETKKEGILYLLFEKHPFFTPFLVIMILWLPLLILFYPGFLMGDTVSQIFMAFNMENKFGLQVIRPNEAIWITNQHPVAHTMLIGVCMRIGQALADSDTLGYFIYTFVQTTFVAAALAYAMSFLTKIKTAYVIRIAVMAFYIVHPLFVTYAILGTKDTIFASFALILLITIAQMVYDRNAEGLARKELILYFVSVIGCVLFRKNAYHMLLLTIPFLFLVVKRMRKVLLVSFVVLIAFQSLYTNVFLVKAEIADGSEKDLFSIPFQQTARYLRDYEEEVTEEEEAAIRAVLNYDYIKEKYDPLKSDAVKSTYKNERTDEEFAAYIKAWFEMFSKHPVCYLEATIENTYGYYCFLEEPIENWRYTQNSAASQQKRVAEQGFDIHFAEWSKGLRAVVTRVQQLFVYLPIISYIMQGATYMWITIFVCFEYLKKKRFKELGLYLPVVLLLGMCIMSPVNGSIYFRYMYPVAFLLPVLLAVSLRYKVMEEGK